MGNKPASALHQSAKPGEIITLGTYPQMAGGSDNTPIQWRVLQNSGQELLLLSAYILDCRRYNDPARAVFIGTRASIRHYARVNRTDYGVRPAVKLNLQLS